MSATVTHHVQQDAAMLRTRYASHRRELRLLAVGRTFTTTFAGRYSARCARNALAMYCRNKLGYQIEVYTFGNRVEIKRTK